MEKCGTGNIHHPSLYSIGLQEAAMEEKGKMLKGNQSK